MSKFKRQSFRKKILFIISSSLILVLSVLGLGVTGIEFWLNEKKLQQDVSVLANILGNRSRAALEFDDAMAAQTNLQAARFNKYVEQICLYDASRTLFAEYRRPNAPFACDAHLTVRPALSWQFYSFSQSVEHLDYPLGEIQITATRTYLIEAILYYVLLIVGLILVVVGVTTQLIKRVLKTVTQPLEDLHQTAQALVEDAYSERRVTRYTDDEIGELVEVINRMLDTLAHENKALQASEHRFRALTVNAPIGIFQVDTEQNLIYANDVWYQITGTRGKDNPYAAHRNKINGDDLEFYHAAWLRAKEKNTTSSVEYSYRQSRGASPTHLMEHIVPMDSKAGVAGTIGTVADVTELKTAQKELEKLAFYDPLTGLPNRRFLLDLLSFGLAKAKRSGTKAAVLMMDMDNFKKVNDLLGHAAGDQVLKQQAQRIRGAVREQDAVSRMGGDEFTIVLSPVEEAVEVTSLAKRVLDAVNTPVVVQNHTIDMGASIGVALFPSDGENAEDLIRNADMALYEAKSQGRNRVNFFSYKLDLELREALRLEQRLKQAIRDGMLKAFVQPQVSIEGKVVWAEALTRWIDPEEGFISPDRFIPLAEETGLIIGLGHWILEEICFHLANHRPYLGQCGIEGISVNLSGRQFFSRNLLHEIERVIETSKVSPTQLEFELTESVIMDDSQSAIDVMRKIRDLGCKIAIDDFGTGYSSLAYLKRFPINSLKIDRSFVEDIPHDEHGSEIATAIIAMAHKLKLSVVAEGVETEAQRDFLMSQGCDIMQGYLFGRPIDIQDYVNEGRKKMRPGALRSVSGKNKE